MPSSAKCGSQAPIIATIKVRAGLVEFLNFYWVLIRRFQLTNMYDSNQHARPLNRYCCFELVRTMEIGTEGKAHVKVTLKGIP